MEFKRIKKAIEFFLTMNTLVSLSRKRKVNRAYLLLTPLYMNYGDHSIAIEELRLLKKRLSNYEIVEVDHSFLTFWPDKFFRKVEPQDILILTGGGYMGDLWPELQLTANDVLRRFPDNNTVIFPQSIYFCEGYQNSLLYQQTREVFSSHNKLWVFTREEYSFQFVTRELLPEKNHCFLVPDMVEMLEPSRAEATRKGALLVFRDDQEGIIDQRLKNKIVSFCKRRKLRADSTSMMIRHMEIPTWLRKFFVHHKLKIFSNKEIVFTDRLHGMLFAYITHTPCLAFDNISRKISGVYQWIKDCPYIEIATDDWENQLARLISVHSKECDIKNMVETETKFQSLFELLERIEEHVI